MLRSGVQACTYVYAHGQVGVLTSQLDTSLRTYNGCVENA